ncbi:hypothetical protein KIN20_026460 [Parelaphostrongylus tenuis]|uniref:MOSC domain-containing protein n=1 Tax=Parelaphostrongylus tenuis TaxID=148309 RepID=A0AAD5WCW1_PARTN|nr:hypothetical protein KIN20_026460 [Parelaphostrongylus tenuis]
MDPTLCAKESSTRINYGSIYEIGNKGCRCIIAVTIERFRPVILIDKCSAYDEDNWLTVHIGEVSLQCLKPCLR